MVNSIAFWKKLLTSFLVQSGKALGYVLNDSIVISWQISRMKVSENTQSASSLTSMFTATGCGNDAPPEEGEQLEDVEEEDEIGDGEIDDE